MRWAVRIMTLILLGAQPLGLSAQGVSYPPAAAGSDIALTAYQQPQASQQNPRAESPTQPGSFESRTSSAGPTSPRLPLPPRAATDRTETGKQSDGIRSLVTVGGSLAAVLGLFFLVVWVFRRASQGGSGTLPREAFEVLGRASLANHQQAQLVRCGSKLLLVSVNATGGGVKTLTEITDSAEVERLSELCRQARANNSKTSFRQVLRQAEGRRA